MAPAFFWFRSQWCPWTYVVAHTRDDVGYYAAVDDFGALVEVAR